MHCSPVQVELDSVPFIGCGWNSLKRRRWRNLAERLQEVKEGDVRPPQEEVEAEDEVDQAEGDEAGDVPMPKDAGEVEGDDHQRLVTHRRHNQKINNKRVNLQ